jgi:hypothetical protein
MNRRVLIPALAAAAALAAVPATAEVSVTRPAGGSVEFFFEPSATGPWGRVRPEVLTSDMLNPQGDARADGWPSTALRADGLPSVAYATAGDAGDVWLSWHDGVAWRPAVNVSHRSGADSGPTVVLDQWNNRFLAWNNARGSRMAVTFTGVRSDGTAQLGVSELTARQREGRRPSLAAFDADVYVAYEEQANGNEDVPYIAIDRLIPPRNSDWSINCSGENTADLSRSATIRTCLTDRSLLADTQVNVESGSLWVTWIDNRTRVGWVELVTPGVFSAPAYRPYDPTLGPDSARDDIREQVLAP